MEGVPQPVSPVVEVLTQSGEAIRLTWANTTVLTYRESAYNHVQWTDEEGNRMGFVTPQSVMDALFEREFPYCFSPVLPDETREWFTQLAAQGADEELDELLNGAA